MAKESTIRKGMNQRNRSRKLWYTAVIFLPVLQFCIFYIYAHANSFILAFQAYKLNPSGRGYIIDFAGFDNFKTAFQIIGENIFMLKNSFVFFLLASIAGLTLAIIFSFYVYKKYWLSGTFRVVLFLPAVVSHTVIAMLFYYLCMDVYPYIVELTTGQSSVGLFNIPTLRFPAVVLFNLWIGFGANVILFSGSMSGINPSVVESAQIDGANIIQEFWYVTLPSVYPTLVTFLIVQVSNIFMNQMELYTLFGNEAGDLSTFGYFFYLQTTKSDILSSQGYYSYSELSATGLIFTAILFPITYFGRKLLEKFGPSVD